MDPDSYDGPQLSKIERETELQQYGLFPMYPIGQYEITFLRKEIDH